MVQRLRGQKLADNRTQHRAAGREPGRGPGGDSLDQVEGLRLHLDEALDTGPITERYRTDVTVTGDLTIKGVTKPVTVDFTFTPKK